MIGIVNERIPHIVKKLIKTNLCSHGGKQIAHDWGSVFLFEDYIVFRIFGCSQDLPPTPNIPPKYFPKRLGKKYSGN